MAIGPIKASTTKNLNEAIIAIGDYAVGANARQRNAPRLALTTALATTVQRVRMLGSAATDLAWVAEGRLDGCVILSNKPWDTAAGVFIASEAAPPSQTSTARRTRPTPARQSPPTRSCQETCSISYKEHSSPDAGYRNLP
jgi:myo-inositol-1(or 4)-monophosphatase